MEAVSVCQGSPSYHELMRQLGNQPGGMLLVCARAGPARNRTAQAISASLHRELIRVDLSRVVSEYIGETEANLRQVLCRAEELDVILLLDEGDALLGRRSSVRSANDRYANQQTDYVLQGLRASGHFVILAADLNPAELRRVRKHLRAVIRPPRKGGRPGEPS